MDGGGRDKRTHLPLGHGRHGEDCADPKEDCGASPGPEVKVKAKEAEEEASVYSVASADLRISCSSMFVRCCKSESCVDDDV